MRAARATPPTPSYARAADATRARAAPPTPSYARRRRLAMRAPAHDAEVVCARARAARCRSDAEPLEGRRTQRVVLVVAARRRHRRRPRRNGDALGHHQLPVVGVAGERRRVAGQRCRVAGRRVPWRCDATQGQQARREAVVQPSSSACAARRAHALRHAPAAGRADAIGQRAVVIGAGTESQRHVALLEAVAALERRCPRAR
mmetsp:Transcript_11488/g.32654  ORF Transcript_11488/g.32654 Transcript_11488/m.32654 type:complete len:203 (+) Transcript_11488:144-752(+)